MSLVCGLIYLELSFRDQKVYLLSQEITTLKHTGFRHTLLPCTFLSSMYKESLIKSGLQPCCLKKSIPIIASQLILS